MPGTPAPALQRALATVAVAAAAGILAGGLTLIGWLVDSAPLRALLPGAVPMNPLTAVGFIVAGTALWLAREGSPLLERRLAAVLAGAVAVLGLLTVARYAVGWDAGLDTVLFRSKLERVAGGPNRMALNTSLSFLLIGVALLLLDTETRRGARPTQHLTLAIAAVSLFVITGYAYHEESLEAVGSSIPMALNAAIGFAALAIGILAARPRQGIMAIITSERASGVSVRRLLPAVIGIPLCLGWLRLRGEQAGLYDTEFGVALSAISTTVLLTIAIWWNARRLDRAERQRELAETALRQSEERQRAILDNTTAVVYLKDPAGRYLFANRRFEELFHLTLDEVVGKRDHDLFPRVLADTYRANDLRVLTSGAALELEEQAQQDDGLHTYVSVKFPLTDAGVSYALCGISTDITARKRMEQEAARLHERIAVTNRVLRVLATSPDTDMYADVLSVVLEALESCVGLFGYIDENGDLVSARMSHAAADDCRGESMVVPRSSWRGLWGRALLEKRSLYENEPQPGRDGQPTSTRSLAAAIVHQGEVLGALQVAERDRDFDEDDRALLEAIAVAIAPALSARLQHAREEHKRRRAEEQLRALAAQLQGANEGLESFSYSVSHDLRAPLRAIDGFARILVAEHAGSLDDEGRRMLGVVCDNSRQMGRLIDDLLAFSRLGRKELAKAELDMGGLARAAAEQALRADPEHRVAVEIGALPRVLGDASLVRQVLVNLIGNAWKFTRGRPAPAIEVGARMDAGETVYFVRDNGVGFDMRYAPKLFGVFQRLHAQEEFEGTGVGLAIVQRVIERHGGRVWAEGQVGAGATFYFTLPAEGEESHEHGRGGDTARGGQRGGRGADAAGSETPQSRQQS